MKFFLLFLLLALGNTASSSSLSSQNNINDVTHQKYFNVLHYGAVGDGVTVDNKAFENAWKATCSSNHGSPTMLVPRNKNFLLQPIIFSGPCSSDSVKVMIEGDLVAPCNPQKWSCNLHGKNNCKQWINFDRHNGLHVSGNGTLNGKGQQWWRKYCSDKIEGDLVAPCNPQKWSCNLHGKNNCKQWINFDRHNGLHVSGNGTLNGKGQQWWRKYCSDKLHCQKRPHSFTITNSNRVQLGNLAFIDSPQMHILIKGSAWVNVTSLTIRAPGYSPNTDGIHLQDSQHVSIKHIRIGTGDDCISIGGGTSYVRISSIICGPGHGISVGSLGIDGKTENVNNIHVSYVEFRGSTNGARIKTWQGGRGYAKDIIFEKIKSVGVTRLIVIDQNYCDRKHCKKQKSAVQISDITFRDIEGTSRYGDAITIECSEYHPCTNMIMERTKLRSPPRSRRTKSTCVNVVGMRSHHVSPLVRCLSRK